MQNVVGNEDDRSFIAHVSTDGGSNYDEGSNYRYGGNTDNDIAYVVSGTGSSSNEQFYAEFWLYAPHQTTYTHMRTHGVNIDINGYVYPAGGQYVTQWVAVHKSAADVDGIQFKFNGGTIKSGLIRMYGLKKA